MTLPVLLPTPQPRPQQWLAGLYRPATIAILATALLASTAWAEVTTTRPGVLALLAKWFPAVFQGFLFNLLVGILAMAMGTALGTALGLALVSRTAPLRRAAWWIMQFFRNAPWLVLLFYAMFLLPYQVTVLGLVVPLPSWLKAVIGLALPVMANVAEIVRGGVQSIPTAQWESAESLAFNRRQTLWMIVLPQAFRRMIPPWMNQYAVLVMATTLISIVGIQDALTIARAALSAESRTDLLIPMYLMLLAMFFLYSYPIARWTLALERRVAVRG